MDQSSGQSSLRLGWAVGLDWPASIRARLEGQPGRPVLMPGCWSSLLGQSSGQAGVPVLVPDWWANSWTRLADQSSDQDSGTLLGLDWHNGHWFRLVGQFWAAAPIGDEVL